MYQVIIVIQVLVGLSIIGLVLMQHGKGADAGAAFGSGSSGTVFGAQGSASFLSRATGILAVVFFASSLGLAVLSGYVEESVDIMDIPVEESLADVPLSGNSDAGPMSVPSIAEQQQQAEEELPVVVDTAVQQSGELIQSSQEMLEQTVQEVPVVIEEQIIEEVEVPAIVTD